MPRDPVLEHRARFVPAFQATQVIAEIADRLDIGRVELDGAAKPDLGVLVQTLVGAQQGNVEPGARRGIVQLERGEKRDIGLLGALGRAGGGAVLDP